MLGWIVRTVVLLLPIVIAILVSLFIAGQLGPQGDVGDALLTWLLLAVVSTVVVVVVERIVHRALPLALLLDMTMLFPGQAPSRFRVALQSGGIRQLRARLERASASGDTDIAYVAELILALAFALSSHDRLTRGHSERVRAYSELLGVELGLSAADLDRLRWAALLHDIGKLEVPPRLLNKPGAPTDEEWNVLRRHPTEGERLARPLLPWLGSWGAAIGQHHERVDGTGYPNGLRGDAISTAARIVAVADAFETMTAPRSYRGTISVAAAHEELTRCAGEHFDPRVVRAMLAVSTRRLSPILAPLVWLFQLPIVRGLAIQGAGTVAVAVVASSAVVAVGPGGVFEGEAPAEIVSEIVSEIAPATTPTPSATASTAVDCVSPVATITATATATGSVSTTASPAATPAPTSTQVPDECPPGTVVVTVGPDTTSSPTASATASPSPTVDASPTTTTSPSPTPSPS